MGCGECFVTSYVYIGFRRYDTLWLPSNAILIFTSRAITIYFPTNTLSEH
jgi:hypothetical protein